MEKKGNSPSSESEWFFFFFWQGEEKTDCDNTMKKELGLGESGVSQKKAALEQDMPRVPD